MMEVFPAPRKPVKTVIGMGAADMEGDYVRDLTSI